METLTEKLKELRERLKKNEVWRNVNFDAMLTDALRLPHEEECGVHQFHCEVPNLDVHRVVVENGYCQKTLRRTAEGIVIGSLRAAHEEMPEKVAKALGRCEGKNDYCQMNAEGWTDGAFVYVPAGCVAQKPIQLLSIHTANDALLLQTRNVVVVEEGSHVCLIHCDDSTNERGCFANNVTELLVESGASVEWYKMQNLNDRTGLLNHAYATIAEGARLKSVGLTLNGGHIRNHYEVRMTGRHCDTEVHGLYLNDRSQVVDNYVFVEHQQPDCHSHELFKGILDDSAQGIFNGHVMVRDGATKTEAYQSNRNILLTDKATIYTKPFLEIYNDDVKCSHGSTIGQIDEEAMFYLRSRGISERSARTLLLYAFCDEVVQKIDFAPLRQRMTDIIKQRLHGELTVCADCVLGCETPCGCNDAQFEIDASKL